MPLPAQVVQSFVPTTLFPSEMAIIAISINSIYLPSLFNNSFLVILRLSFIVRFLLCISVYLCASLCLCVSSYYFSRRLRRFTPIKTFVFILLSFIFSFNLFPFKYIKSRVSGIGSVNNFTITRSHIQRNRFNKAIF